MRREVRKDLKAEKLSVVDVSRKIRDNESLSSIPVAMVTNSNLEADEQQPSMLEQTVFCKVTLSFKEFSIY